ncbi:MULTISPECIES: hypothetical protein [Mycobacterium]|uniref:hypothetical protein n=1 Tax=Mycobacterium TaxID=1763 RepID=UPI001403315A|nr:MULTISPECIES: hypothetical protein [Mycobacterium]MDM4138576.1 hypothetical protein [Mycobacterium sp. FLAC0960]
MNTTELSQQPEPGYTAATAASDGLCTALNDLADIGSLIDLAASRASSAATLLEDSRCSRAIELLELLDVARRHAERLKAVVLGDIRALGADGAVDAAVQRQHPAGGAR